MESKVAKIIISMIAFLLISGTVALAENKQTFIIGGDVGSYSFSQDDLSEVENPYFKNEYIEWFFWDQIGIGIRSHALFQLDTTNVDEELSITNIHLAATWIFLGSEDDLRMALYAGSGPANITYKNNETDLEFTSSVTSTSAGIYADWGGDTWGVRLSYHTVSAQFEYDETIDSGTIDASGSAICLGLRIALNNFSF